MAVIHLQRFCCRHGASLTGVHAGEHEAQGSHGPVGWWHVNSVHAELDQRFAINSRQLLWQEEALEPAQNAVIDDGGCGVFTGRHHHATQLQDGDGHEPNCSSILSRGTLSSRRTEPNTNLYNSSHKLRPYVQRIVLHHVEGHCAHDQHVLLVVEVHATVRGPGKKKKYSSIFKSNDLYLSIVKWEKGGLTEQSPWGWTAGTRRRWG